VKWTITKQLTDIFDHLCHIFLIHTSYCIFHLHNSLSSEYTNSKGVYILEVRDDHGRIEDDHGRIQDDRGRRWVVNRSRFVAARWKWCWLAWNTPAIVHTAPSHCSKYTISYWHRYTWLVKCVTYYCEYIKISCFQFPCITVDFVHTLIHIWGDISKDHNTIILSYL